MWNKLGVNYKSQVHVAEDIALFKKLGLNKVRIHIPGAHADLTSFYTWAVIAKQFFDEGFYVIFGVTSDNIVETSTLWPTYHDNCVAAAAYCQANPICSEFQIGNEAELHVDGDTITNTTGIRNLLRTLATDVKVVLSNIPISYSVSGMTSAEGITGWVSDAEGKGDLDFIGLNAYGNIQSNGAVFWKDYKTVGDAGFAEFGASMKITEFNLDPTINSLRMLETWNEVRKMDELRTYIDSLGVTEAYLYEWRGSNDANDDFAIALKYGGFKKTFYTLTK